MKKLVLALLACAVLTLLLVSSGPTENKSVVEETKIDSRKQTTPAKDQHEPKAQQANKAEPEKEQSKPRPADTRTTVSYHSDGTTPAVVKCVSGFDKKTEWTEYYRPDGTLEREEFPGSRYVGTFDSTGKHAILRQWKYEDGGITQEDHPVGGKRTRKEFRPDGSLRQFIEYPSDKQEVITTYGTDGKTVWWTEERNEVSSAAYKSTIKIHFDPSGKRVNWTLERDLCYPDELSSNGPAQDLATDIVKRADGTVLYKFNWCYTFSRAVGPIGDFIRVCKAFEEYAADGKTLVRRIERNVEPSTTGDFPVTFEMRADDDATVSRWYRADGTLERELTKQQNGRLQVKLFSSKENIKPSALPKIMERQFGFPY